MVTEFEVKRNEDVNGETENEEVFAVEDEEEGAPAFDGEEEDEFEPVGTFQFLHPIMIDGKEVSETHYDFNQLKPIQYLNIVKAVSRIENTMVSPELNVSVQANVFCKAADLPTSVIKTQMSVPDFTAACRLARAFLLTGIGQKPKEDMIL